MPSEEAVQWTAMTANRLGLPGLSNEAALAARDKHLMRIRFQEAGLNYANHRRLKDSSDLASLQDLQFPLVVKPTCGWGSGGVVRADTPQELETAVAKVESIIQGIKVFTEAQDENLAEILVEEYIDGPEYAVETFSHQGGVHVLSIGYKGYPQGPYFEEGSYRAPAQLPEELLNRIAEESIQAVRSLGIDEGPGHVELRLQGGQEPYILEIGARLGGSGVSHVVVQGSTGIDFARLHLESALGRPPYMKLERYAKPTGCAANYIIPLKGSGRFVKIKNLETVRNHPATLRIFESFQPGQEIEPYPKFSGFPGFVLSQHQTYEECLEFHRLLDRTIAPIWE